MRVPAPALTLALTPALILALPLALALLATPGHAAPEATFPGLADVTGVAADDVLNIRAEPSASAAIIGSFAPDAAGIEVVETRNGWLRVALPETSGWISGRFATMRRDLWQPDAVPAGLACHGTEPFWSLTLDGAAAQFSTPAAATRHEGLRIFSPFDGAENPRRAITADGLVALVTPAPQLCSDGMSDARFGLDVDLVTGSGEDARYLRGCCSIGR